jgi:DNA-binding transcriptional MerR regulator
MRIAELSRQTGVPVATIKYYLREGLLPVGEATGPNQAQYGEEHVRRLRLIRALVTVGGVSIASVGAVLEAIDAVDRPLHDRLGVVQASVTKPPESGATEDEQWAVAQKRVDDLIARHKWHANGHSAPGRRLASVLVAIDRLDYEFTDEMLDTYADAVEKIADVDLDSIADRTHPEDLVVGMVVGTVLGDEVLTAMRRLAHIDQSRRRYG